MKTKLNKVYILVSIILMFLILPFTEISCKRRPPKVISEDKMVKLMADMQLMEAYMHSNSNNFSRSEDNKKYAEAILRQNGVSKEELDSTLAWYGRNLDEYSLLYDKIDKEIKRRQNNLAKESGETIIENDSEDIWPYQRHSVLIENGNSDGWVFSFNNPGIKKGETVNWNLYFPETANIRGVLGVEYSDGSNDNNIGSLTNNHYLELTVVTDTAKSVNRLYGWIELKTLREMPVYADSISLTVTPFDSISNRNNRGLRKYGPLEHNRIKPEVKKPEVKDSLQNTALTDTIPAKK